MKKILFFFTILVLMIVSIRPSFAITDPLVIPNNKFGIHILFPSEIQDAAKLINSNGGEWGYVTIPIQAGDRNLEVWQKFMDDAKDYRVIPLIRLATEGDYFNTKVWRKPKLEDVLDFANFLDSLDWPVKNRYVIVFNEVNRSDEWGGKANPLEYAEVLNYAASVFKLKNPDFFVISAGLDNAAANNANLTFNEYNFLRTMNAEIPGIFERIDGISSHSYPNPAFSSTPAKNDQSSVASFKHEKNLIESFTNNKNLPVFITETGWSKKNVSETTISHYYKDVFSGVWSDQNIVAITPFLLRANAGPFTVFSFLNENGTPDMQYKSIEEMPKIKGLPVISKKILGEQTALKNVPLKHFNETGENEQNTVSKKTVFETIYKWILKI
ncbi:MAG: hypothetical protein Q7K55_06190 [Candidatus Levybacteria bacterium]|nr:hypothetical protein [Candidatus Levybacteria bacterium]